MITRAYSRCNSGHYFRGECCPIDGWSSPAAVELENASQRLEQAGRPVTLKALVEEGISARSLARIIVIEFGSEAAVFDAIAPEGYVVDGKWVPMEDLEDAFL